VQTRGSIEIVTGRRYFGYSKGDFEVFCCTPIITHISAEMGRGPPKLEILTKFWYINTPHGRIPWAMFTKFSSFVGSFMDRHVSQFGQIRLMGFGVMEF